MIFYAGMDSWVYILFGLLWIAFAIYKGNNKVADDKAAGGKTSPPASSGFENIIDSFIGEEDTAEVFPGNRVEEVVKNHVVVTEEPIVKPEKPADFEEVTPFPAMSEMPAETSCMPKVRRMNMKKAVIYSEILRRPYE